MLSGCSFQPASDHSISALPGILRLKLPTGGFCRALGLWDTLGGGRSVGSPNTFEELGNSKSFWKLTKIISIPRLWKFLKLYRIGSVLLPLLPCLITHISLSLSGLWLYWPPCDSSATPHQGLSLHTLFILPELSFPPGDLHESLSYLLCLFWNIIFLVKLSLIPLFNTIPSWHSLLSFTAFIALSQSLALPQ